MAITTNENCEKNGRRIQNNTRMDIVRGVIEMTSGQRIKEHRLNLGETMEEFGRRFNAHKSIVSKWEKT